MDVLEFLKKHTDCVEKHNNDWYTVKYLGKKHTFQVLDDAQANRILNRIAHDEASDKPYTRED